MIKKVYFDMDGVLVDFDESIKIFTGLTGEEIIQWGKENNNNDPIGHFMNVEIDNGLFEKAPAMPEFIEFKHMIDWLLAKGIEVEILSSASQEKCADKVIEQKKKWLNEKGIYCKQNFVYGWKNKAEYASSENLLIDDLEKSIRKYEEKGGVAIHHKNIAQTVKEFINYFPDYQMLTLGIDQQIKHTKKISF